MAIKNYDIYKHSERGYEVVKIGFSWPAFLFSWMWAFTKKLWLMGFVFIGIASIIAAIEILLEESGNDGVAPLLSLGLLVWFGSNGNTWRIKKLKKIGYKYIQTLKAETPIKAVSIAKKV